MKEYQNLLKTILNKITSFLYYFIKRSSDIILSVILLLIFSPVLIFIYFRILFTEFRNPIIAQKRAISLEKPPFKIYKFRTMIVNEDNLLKENLNFNICLRDDLSELVTPIGKWLRRTGLDELPQLFNVLIGNMSLIGPRPLTLPDINYIKTHYPEYYNLRKELKAKPGISGYWQIFGDRKAGIQNLIDLDYFYEDNRSVSLDIMLLLMTIPLVLFAGHSDAIVKNEREPLIHPEKESLPLKDN